MTAQEIKSVLFDMEHNNPPVGRCEKALVELANLAVSVLRMIDARRESGVKFGPSYNEDELRRAVEPLAAQTFPPGPPMREPRSQLFWYETALTAVMVQAHRERKCAALTEREVADIVRCVKHEAETLALVTEYGWERVMDETRPDTYGGILGFRQAVRAGKVGPP